MVPFDGDVTITCASDAPALGETPVTPAPTASGTTIRGGIGDDDEATRAPVGPEDGSDSGPGADGAATDGSSGEDSGGDSNTGVIAGSVVGGIALLAIAGVVAYKLKKSPPPPPSYDDLVGSA